MNDFATPDIRKETDAFKGWSPIGKTFRSFDNMLPVEDPDKLAVILTECKKKPDTDPVLDALNELLNIAAKIGCTAEIVERGEQMEDSPAGILNHWFGPISEPGTRFTISGGEVDKLPDPTKSPIEFGSAAWFAGIDEIPFEGKE